MPSVNNSSPESVVAGGSGGAVSKVKEVCDALASCGSPISDLEKVATVLNGLPCEYQRSGQWFVDSGASHHVTPVAAKIVEGKDYVGPGSKGRVSRGVTDEGRCLKISNVPILPGVEQLLKASCLGHSVCGVSSQFHAIEVGDNAQVSCNRIPRCSTHSRAAGVATPEVVPIVGEPAGNESMTREDSLVVEYVNEEVVIEEDPLVVELTDGESRLEKEPLHEKRAGNDVLLAGSFPSTTDRFDCHVGLPYVHNVSDGEFQSVNESLGNHVDSPESLERCGSSSDASGTIGDLGSEGCITLGEIAVEAPDEIVATDSLVNCHPMITRNADVMHLYTAIDTSEVYKNPRLAATKLQNSKLIPTVRAHNPNSPIKLEFLFCSSMAMAMAMAMAYDDFLHHVFPSQINSERHPVPSSQLQVELTLNFTLLLRCLHSVPLLSFPVTAQETLTFDLMLLHQRNQVHQVLAPVFTSLGINSSYYDTMVDTIIRCRLEIADWTFERGFNCKVLRLDSVIHATVEVSAPRLEFIMSRVLAEEMETSGYGMVPAQESSLREMVETVRVEEGDEDCTICLEGFEAGSYAARMPCSHIFHAECIQEWLKQSHYCPLCRFEMPY
ncbi:hypothetical protein V6N11_024560 [Hibiscus sabdariffa]|uniref:RING-type E3 ubiquitin transferase n=1 Tax=Hibiscus sabdariffa TaxID=183260 RepID=A0ABR2QMG2_9ROSI